MHLENILTFGATDVLSTQGDYSPQKEIFQVDVRKILYDGGMRDNYVQKNKPFHVQCVVWLITEKDEKSLDGFEGVGKGCFDESYLAVLQHTKIIRVSN